MKRFILAAALLCLTAAVAFAQDNYPRFSDEAGRVDMSSRYVLLDVLLSNRAMEDPVGVAYMAELSDGLDPYLKRALYGRYVKDPVGAAAMNFFTGGLGSWGMGDRLAGGILTAGGVFTLAASVLMVMPMDFGVDRRTIANVAMASGAVVGAVGIAFPFYSAYRSNARLKKALNY